MLIKNDRKAAIDEVSILKAVFSLAVIVSSSNAAGLFFPEKAPCTSSTNCAIKASSLNHPVDAGLFIALELKALEHLNYETQSREEYLDSRDALRKMVALFVDGSAAMPGVFGGWIIQTDRLINNTIGALLLAYEVEESRSPDPYGVDWLADYQGALSEIKNSPDYESMKALSLDPKQLSAVLLEEAKSRAVLVQTSL